jgi:ABC-2 type transport system permease protein
LIVIGVFTIVAGIVGFVVEPNMGRLIGDVHTGTLDFMLTKPADAQLLVSVREFRVWKLTDVVLGVGVVIWGASQLKTNISAIDIIGFVATLIMGIIALYCFWLILASGAFWIVRVGELQELFTGLYRAGQYPVGVYPGWLRLSLTFLVPLAIAITVPAEALTARLTLGRFLIVAGFVVALTVLTRAIWRRGLKRYAGASA